MTPDVLWLLKNKLAKANMDLKKKRLLWAAATFLFVGSFRSGEILPTGKSYFAKDTTLRNRNISLLDKVVEGEEARLLEVKLEAPKEDKKRKGSKC